MVLKNYYCYFENKEKGLVYDSDYKEVGIFKNKTIILN
jgi:hypothetical protein